METDQATDALIAQFLWAEENPYYNYADEGANDDDSDGSDYGSNKKKSRKQGKKGGKVAKAPVVPKTKGTTASRSGTQAGTGEEHQDGKENVDWAEDGQVGGVSATGRRKRKDTGQSRAKGRAWTDEEEVKFLEAMDIHGRDWKKCADHMGTRDSRGFASHAQKYFIKLCLAGKPLPPKVAESGIGYTLSGKLLDPKGAATIAYGFKPELLKKLEGQELQTALAGLMVEHLDLAVHEGATQVLPLQDHADPGQPVPADKPAAPKAAPRPRKRKAEATDGAAPVTAAPMLELSALQAIPPQMAPPPQQTEYARNRPRREIASSRAQMGLTTESLDLVKCTEYVGVAGSGAPLSQPFTVEYNSQVMLLMDFHAHLSRCEIIGLLGGTWDAERRHIQVIEAYPCRRAVCSDHSHDARTSVELDPEAEVEVRALMEANEQRCVGWYHSHPVFEPSPSAKDMDNQRNYQALFRDPETQLEPFLGIIMGPMDVSMPKPTTAVTTFVVQQRSNNLVPYAVRYTVSGRDELPEPDVLQKLLDLIGSFREDIGRVDFSELWRPFTTLENGMPAGPPMTKIAKLMSSLRVHLSEVEPAEAEDFLLQLGIQLEQQWQLQLGLNRQQPEAPSIEAEPQAPPPC